MGVNVSKIPKDDTTRRNVPRENVSNKPSDQVPEKKDGRGTVLKPSNSEEIVGSGNKDLSEKASETADSTEECYGSDEVKDYISPYTEKNAENTLVRKSLFECDIIPVSSTVLKHKCENCDEYVKCKYVLFYMMDSCIAFGRTDCEHDALFCSRNYVFDSCRLSNTMNFMIKSLSGKPLCASNGKMYSSFDCLVYEIHMEVNEQKESMTIVSRSIFEASGPCSGMAGFDGGLALLVKIYGKHFDLPPWQIQFVDISGKVKRYVYKKSSGEPLLTSPTTLASNYDENILYVVDGINIFVLDVNGDLLHCITLESIPTCITADSDQNIYVVCGKDLLMINQHFERRVLLRGSEKSSQIEAVTWVNQFKSVVVIRDDWITLYKLMN